MTNGASGVHDISMAHDASTMQASCRHDISMVHDAKALNNALFNKRVIQGGAPVFKARHVCARGGNVVCVNSCNNKLFVCVCTRDNFSLGVYYQRVTNAVVIGATTARHKQFVFNCACAK